MVEFFQTNREIVFFIYGLAFFILGLAAALQSRKRSRIALARHLWLLATFGIVHGIYEWGAVFIPIQQNYLGVDAVNVLVFLRLLLEAVSFFTLFQFGIELIPLGSQTSRLRLLPLGLFSLWAIIVLLLEFLTTLPFLDVRTLGDIFARYLLGVPGASAAAWGLWQQARQVNQMDLERIARYFRGAALVFTIYALSSAVVPRADFFPASILNYDFLLQTLGVPAAIIRAVCGTLIAYLTIRGLEIFEIETERQLEEATRARAVAGDRERIGRELHDGIIQSLYAAGLTLEDAALAIDEDAPHAKNKIGNVITTLNHTIRDLRSYILDLKREPDGRDCQTDLEEMVRAFRLQTFIDAEFRVEGKHINDLAVRDKQEILAIAREALINIGKHSRATHVSVVLNYFSGKTDLAISDNGIGFVYRADTLNDLGLHQGLRNMHQRAELIGARLSIDSQLQRGTTIHLSVPHAA